MKVLQKLIPNESTYRSSTHLWFEHSPLLVILKGLCQKKAILIITAEHGSIRVNQPCGIVGTCDTTTNLRYKQGGNLSHNHKKPINCNTYTNTFRHGSIGIEEIIVPLIFLTLKEKGNIARNDGE